MYRDTQEEVLEDTLEAVKRLATAGFMLNLCKSQLVQAMAQVLGHLWTSGGFWAPNHHQAHHFDRKVRMVS